MKRTRVPKRLRLDLPHDFAGLGLVFITLSFALMTEVSWWRWCAYAAAACGLIAWWMHDE